MNSTAPTLVVEELQTHFFTKQGAVKAVDGVSFTVKPGSVLGLVGESGSGKSVTGLSIMGLLDHPGRIVNGKILFNGQDIVNLPEEDMRRLRGTHISMIFQDSIAALNPVLRIDTQMIEALRAHGNIGKKTALECAGKALSKVGIPSAKIRLKSYPHQFSGGMRQRVAIAIAMLNKPDLIIADEPTTALDVTIQAQILSEVQKLCRENATALIWITHDLTVVAGLADDLCVMYAGKIVEKGSVDEVLSRPLHPYTVGLIGSVPSHNRRGQTLYQIPGMTPSLLNLPRGCTFRERCPRADEVCREEPAISAPLPGREVRCFHPHLGD
ncbi:MAG: ABC transporter ATP-binding protein [Desulfarculaceae bacterium]|jgi:peptide/nickel transport system ATP-binding protein